MISQKKISIFAIAFFLFLFLLYFASAVNLDVEKFNSDRNFNNDFLDIKGEITEDSFFASSGEMDESFKGPKYKGYIIEFEDKPVARYKFDLEKEVKENQEYIEESFFLNPRTVYLRFFGIDEKEIDEKVEDYKVGLEVKNERIKSDIISKVGDGEKINSEFNFLFNGLSVDATDAEAKEIEKIRGVKKAWPNMKVEAMLMDSVPLIQGGIPAGNLDLNGNNCLVSGLTCLTGEGVKIAIIDTGVDYTHQDLGGCFGQGCKVIGGYDFVNNDADPMDDMGHGTHVAATATGSGVLNGVAPGANILAYKVLDSDGSGYESDIIEGIERAISDGADIISMSLGGYLWYQNNEWGQCYNEAGSYAVDNAVDFGINVVVAAGNSGFGGSSGFMPGYKTINFPGCAKKVITVGASTKEDGMAYFSSKGPINDFRIKPDIVAPGYYICAAQHDGWLNDSPCLDSEHINISGTSMATPHVAGAIALLKQKNSGWTPDEIKMALKNTAIDLGEDIFTQGYGRIDIQNLIRSPELPVASLNISGVLSGVANIKGEISSNNFQKYRLEYSEGIDSNEWNLFFEAQSIPANGILYRLNTNHLDDGPYMIKLTVINENGVVGFDKSFIIISNNPNEKINLNCSSCGECTLNSLVSNSLIVANEDLEILSEDTQVCFTSLSDDVLFDCNNHKIITNQTPNYYEGPFGALITRGKNVSIQNCFIDEGPILHNGAGITIFESLNGKIKNNTIGDSFHGIELFRSINFEVTENRIRDPLGDGSISVYAICKEYYNHSIINNTVQGFPFYYFFNKSNEEIALNLVGTVSLAWNSNLTIKNSVIKGGINLQNNYNTKILRNMVETYENGWNGIILGRESGGSFNYYWYPECDNRLKNENISILNNTLINQGIKIVEYHSGDSFDGSLIKIQGNSILNAKNGIGVYTRASSVVTTENDIISENAMYNGMDFFNLKNIKVNVSNNTIVGYNAGLNAYESDNIYFVSNKIKNTVWPIHYYNSNNTSIFVMSQNSIPNTFGNYKIAIFSEFPLEISDKYQGNYWGRTSAPYFCEYGNQNASCIDNWDSNRLDAIDSCPYDQPYLPGEWPASPVCPDGTGSKIINNQNVSINGQLSISIQKKVGLNWTFYENVVKNESVELPPRGFFDVRGVFNSQNVSINQSGTYRVYGVFEYRSLNSNENLEGIIPAPKTVIAFEEFNVGFQQPIFTDE
ncbi:MAG: S8 family serine peptidase [Nanoarchaeota archaeon]|nr:S8 family serine peptidase [Nanoarchaeota archaeon]